MKAIIFDLDGTLINSLTDIALSMNDVLKEFEINTHKIDSYKKFVGDGALVLVENALGKNFSKDFINKVLKRFIEVYDLGVHDNTKPYKGIYELLENIEALDIKMAVLSNKPHEFTLKYVETLFCKNKFIEVHGQKEGIPKKPHPKGAINIAKAFNLSCEDIIYVGDTATDIKTAKAANMKSIGVLWGFRDEVELKEAGADFIVKEPSEIFDILQNRIKKN